MKCKKSGIALLVLVFVTAALFAVYMVIVPPKGIQILEYHMVNHTDKDVYNVDPADFAAQMDYLKAEGYTTISMLDFMKAKKGKMDLPAKPIILSFDDGYIDNYTELLPILEERGMKATLFMVTNDIGLDGYLTWDMLRDMQSRGIEIGSHTANHQPLTTLNDKEIGDEIKLSKLLLEWNGIRTIYFFSYPNGAVNDTAIKELKQNDYLAAVTGDAGLNTFGTNPYLLQRTNIARPRFGLMEFKLRLFKAELFTRLGIKQH